MSTGEMFLATVTQVNPLRVKRRVDTVAMPVHLNLAEAIIKDEEVLVEMQAGNRVVVLGRIQSTRYEDGSPTNSTRVDATALPHLQDLNVARPSGFYTVNNPVNGPSDATSWLHLVHMQHGTRSPVAPNTDYAFQLATNLFGANAEVNGPVWVRRKAGGSWGAWSTLNAPNPATNSTTHRAVTDNITNYPPGFSHSYGNVAGWPAGWCHVLTWRKGTSNDGFQMVVDTISGNGPRTYFRNHDSGMTWSAFSSPTGQGDNKRHYVGDAGEVGFANGWANLSSTQRKVSFYKNAAGWVSLQGMLNGSSIGSAAFTLPAGFRPDINDNMHFTLVNNSGLGYLYIKGTAGGHGEVVPWQGSAGWFDLASIAFQAA